MSPPSEVLDRERRFSDLYDDAYADVLRFVRRRSPADAAEDIAHEAFLVAWRRLDDLPIGRDDARAWLFGVARNCLLSDHRARQRYEQLGVRIALAAPASRTGSAEAASIGLDLVAAWQLLSVAQQEVLSLALWEELPAAAAGKALGITAAAYRIRLHRARMALRRNLDPSPTTTLAPATTTEMPA